jgi:hypothetical protein
MSKSRIMNMNMNMSRRMNISMYEGKKFALD